MKTATKSSRICKYGKECEEKGTAGFTQNEIKAGACNFVDTTGVCEQHYECEHDGKKVVVKNE